MSDQRVLPWTDLVPAIGEEHFEEIRTSLAAAKTDDLDRDAFLLNGAVAAVLRDLMPEDAPTEAINAYGALLHMLWVNWARDWPLVPVSADQVARVVASPLPHVPTSPLVCYVQLPPRLAWAGSEEESHEPLDGMFLIARPDRAYALAILGLRAEREGFTTMEGAIRLPAPAPLPRDDGSAPFSPVMPGGREAGLLSVDDEHELVALALGAVRVAEEG